VKRKMDRRRVRKFENCKKKKENNTDELTPKRVSKETFKAKEKLLSFLSVTRGH